MTPQEIILDLKSRGEHSISFHDDGTIVSRHGRDTINYWIIREDVLICIYCKTAYLWD